MNVSSRVVHFVTKQAFDRQTARPSQYRAFHYITTRQLWADCCMIVYPHNVHCLMLSPPNITFLFY